MSSLTVWFSSALLLALLLAVAPRLCARSPAALVLASLVLVPGILFGGYGLYNLFFTFFNMLFLRGLDGEWVNELGPVLDATGILYAITCLLFLRALSFRSRGLVQAVGPRTAPAPLSPVAPRR
jgi:hypothetical protein